MIYLGHLPPNFEEPEIKGFLSQFGHVTRLKLSRSRKTANPRGFAFCEFADPHVAAIVAETMSGYLLSQKRLVCHIVENVRPDLFEGHDRVFTKVDWTARHREQVNKSKSAEAMSRITRRLLAREKKKRETLKAMGIDYDFPGYQASTETVNEVSDQENVEEKEKKKRRNESLDGEEAMEKTAKNRKDSLGSSSEKKASKHKGSMESHGSSSEKTISKRKDSAAAVGSVEKNKTKGSYSDESLGKSAKKRLDTSVEKKQSTLKGADTSLGKNAVAEKNQSKFNVSDTSLGSLEKKQSKLKGADTSLGKSPKKGSDAVAEKNQSKLKISDTSLGSLEKKQLKLKGPDAVLGSAAKVPKRNGSDASLGIAEKKQAKRKSSKNTRLDEIDVTPKKKQTKDIVAMTEVKKTKASKKRRVST